MKHIKVTCDYCEKDLTFTGNAEAWRILLANEPVSKSPGGGAVTLVAVEPHIDGGDKHFCGSRCLVSWVCNKWPVYLEAENARLRNV